MCLYVKLSCMISIFQHTVASGTKMKETFLKTGSFEGPCYGETNSVQKCEGWGHWKASDEANVERSVEVGWVQALVFLCESGVHACMHDNFVSCRFLLGIHALLMHVFFYNIKGTNIFTTWWRIVPTTKFDDRQCMEVGCCEWTTSKEWSQWSGVCNSASWLCTLQNKRS